jgi:hypothetical protein
MFSMTRTARSGAPVQLHYHAGQEAIGKALKLNPDADTQRSFQVRGFRRLCRGQQRGNGPHRDGVG